MFLSDGVKLDDRVNETLFEPNCLVDPAEPASLQKISMLHQTGDHGTTVQLVLFMLRLVCSWKCIFFVCCGGNESKLHSLGYKHAIYIHHSCRNARLAAIDQNNNNVAALLVTRFEMRILLQLALIMVIISF